MFRGKIGDEILPRYLGIIINQFRTKSLLTNQLSRRIVLWLIWDDDTPLAAPRNLPGAWDQ